MTDADKQNGISQEECARQEIEQRFGLQLDRCPYILTEDLLVWRDLLDNGLYEHPRSKWQYE